MWECVSSRGQTSQPHEAVVGYGGAWALKEAHSGGAGGSAGPGTARKVLSPANLSDVTTCSLLQVHVKSEVLAVKLSQEINYAKSLYYEQQLMLRLNESQEQLELDS